MGWVAFVLLAAGTIGVALAAGLPRATAMLVGAALALGGVGYALQGRPGLAGVPRDGTAAPRAAATDPALIELRSAMFGRFTSAEPVFYAADALQRSGSTASAVRLLQGAAASQPGNAALWTGLGDAYATHDGLVSPAARLAFNRAMTGAPLHPGPPFFLGVALARMGEIREARGWWARALALTPPGLSYRTEIAERVRLADLLLASPAGAGLP